MKLKKKKYFKYLLAYLCYHSWKFRWAEELFVGFLKAHLFENFLTA